MTHDEYLAYLRTPWWAARKAAIIRYRGERCERCGCREQLQLHHRTYERLGRELPEDVKLLCRICHQREHGLERTLELWAGEMQPLDVTAEITRIVMAYISHYGY